MNAYVARELLLFLTIVAPCFSSKPGPVPTENLIRHDAQDENLRLTRRTSLEHRPQREQDTSEPRQHRALQLACSRGFITRGEILTSDGIPPLLGNHGKAIDLAAPSTNC